MYDIWETSPSPEESWSDGGENGEWPIKGIVGEEVDTAGEIKYEVAWADWKRLDGTNTTWMPNLWDRPDLVRSWKQKQNKRRRELAEDSLDIEVSNFIDVHNANTFSRAQALAEKTEKKRVRPIRYEQWDIELDKNLVGRDVNPETDTWSKNLRKGAVRAACESLKRSPSVVSASPSVVSSAKDTSGSRRFQSQTPSSSRSVTLVSSLGTSRESQETLTASTPESRIVRALPARAKLNSPSKSPPSRRSALQAAWNKTTKRTGSSSVYIVNEIDNEEVPPVVEHFEYLEDAYIYADDVPQPDTGCLVACECVECVSISCCGCQLSSNREDLNEAFAYADGLFTFELPQGADVIECNELCSCDSSCPNRVAQHPRRFPVEIFKTEHCGWGVRPTVALERGQVLGIYTGKLIQRAAAETLPETHKGYVFDLDSMEREDDDDDDDDTYLYSVDSFECGNWTRFINHSCDPNTRVYPVYYNTVPEMNQPFLAFVATKDIPARIEFTLSYNPAASEALVKGKKKGKQKKVFVDGLPCHCSAKTCLGRR